MNNKEIIKQSLLSSFGVFLYVSGVAWLMQNGEKLFGKMDHVYGTIAFLLLFIFSALITGLLVFGFPALLFFEGNKKEAVKMIVYTTGWLFVITAIALSVNLLLK
jgi:hypothetical protein